MTVKYNKHFQIYLLFVGSHRTQIDTGACVLFAKQNVCFRDLTRIICIKAIAWSYLYAFGSLSLIFSRFKALVAINILSIRNVWRYTAGGNSLKYAMSHLSNSTRTTIRMSLEIIIKKA